MARAVGRLIPLPLGDFLSQLDEDDYLETVRDKPSYNNDSNNKHKAVVDIDTEQPNKKQKSQSETLEVPTKIARWAEKEAIINNLKDREQFRLYFGPVPEYSIVDLPSLFLSENIFSFYWKWVLHGPVFFLQLSFATEEDSKTALQRTFQLVARRNTNGYFTGR